MRRVTVSSFLLLSDVIKYIGEYLPLILYFFFFWLIEVIRSG